MMGIRRIAAAVAACILLSASSVRGEHFVLTVAGSKPAKVEHLAPAIGTATEYFLARYATPKDVNSGRCGGFALMVQAKAGGTILHLYVPGGGGHTVLQLGGRMYDIEHPEGATHFADLKYFKRSAAQG